MQIWIKLQSIIEFCYIILGRKGDIGILFYAIVLHIFVRLFMVEMLSKTWTKIDITKVDKGSYQTRSLESLAYTWKGKT